MTTSAPLESLRGIVEKLFPWLAYVAPASDGGLSLRSAAAKLLHLQGDAGDPGALTTQDTGGQLAADSNGILYYCRPGETLYLPVAVYGFPGPPPGIFAGTPVKLGPGSARVTVAP